MNDNIAIENELGYFQVSALIEKLVHRFAAINGFKIEPDVQVLDAEHLQTCIWVAMQSSTIKEITYFITK